MSTPPPVIAPGWYPDPAGGPLSRWWDGTAWTDHVQDPAGPPAALRAPADTPAYGVWIWLIVFLPYVTLPVAMATIDFSEYFSNLMSMPSDTMQAELALFLSPGYLATIALSVVVMAAVIVFGVADWRRLRALGVPKPFHWAWGFFSVAGYPVYQIGRAIVVHRRTGRGLAVIWVTIALFVLGLVASLVWAAVLFTQIMQLVSPIMSSY